MPVDAYEVGDPESRPYKFPYLARDAETGEPMIALSGDDMTPRPGIINGKRYESVTPIVAGVRKHRLPWEYQHEGRFIEFTVPDAPRINVETMREVTS